MGGFKIVTWNINGLRSFGGAQQWRQIFDDFQADLICFQETKISRNNVEEWMAFVDGYSSYFSFPLGKLFQSGYSGVVTYCGVGGTPLQCEISLHHKVDDKLFHTKFDEEEENIQFEKDWSELITNYEENQNKCKWNWVDCEGRCVVTKHRLKIEGSSVSEFNLHVFNVYCPRNDTIKPEREHYQLRFYHLLQKRAFQLISESEQNLVMIVGDFNVTHIPIDCAQYCDKLHYRSNGIKWITKFLSSKVDCNGKQRYFVDSYRHLYPDKTEQYTCWNTQLGCRVTNFGSRIDFIVVDVSLLPYLVDCLHLTDYVGSDHCPVMAQFDSRVSFDAIKPPKYSIHCSRVWPEFAKQQSSIKQYFSINANQNQQINKNQDESVKKSKSKQTSMLSFVQKYSNDSIKNVEDNKKSLENRLEPKIVKPNQCNVANQWHKIFEKETPPLCSGHNLPCVRRKVKTPGSNQGREFFACSKTSLGSSDHPESRCGFFRWVVSNKNKK